MKKNLSQTTGLCECGCGLPAPIAKLTGRGFKKGEPQRFILGHAGRKHGHASTGGLSPTYRSWRSMLNRVHGRGHEKSHPHYANVKVCKRWLRFDKFLADLGERPFGTTLGRRNDCGDYKPTNAWWQTPKEQREAARKHRRVKPRTVLVRSKLTPHEVDEIRRLREIGMKQRELADLFGVHIMTVNDILNGRTWGKPAAGYVKVLSALPPKKPVASVTAPAEAAA